jgi:hypothetical protein
MHEAQLARKLFEVVPRCGSTDAALLGRAGVGSIELGAP